MNERGLFDFNISTFRAAQSHDLPITHSTAEFAIMVSLSTLNTLLFTLGPLFVPKLISWYHTRTIEKAATPAPKQPVPRPIVTSINILFISALLALISTLPYFAQENIFTTTSSRLQTPNDVLFTRLALMRGESGLTEHDNILRPKLASLDSRLLYFTYGPDVVTHCGFCISDEPMTYFQYALPSILLPHILHMFALGISTSSAMSRAYASRWRSVAAWTAIAVGSIDIYLFLNYDWKANARAHRPEDYVNFYWRMRVFRGVAIALADAVIAGLLWLSSTRRMFVKPITSAERMETAMRVLANANGKLSAVGILRNAMVRNEGLRKKTEAYWRREGQIMGEIMDDREVVEGVRNALGERIKIAALEEDARMYADGITVWEQVKQNGAVPYG